MSSDGPDWKRCVRMHDHLVSTYARSQDPMAPVTAFLMEGLEQGGTALALALPEHRDELERGLRVAGLDLAALEASGRYRSVDAASVADQIAAAQGQPTDTEAVLREVL